MLSRRERQEAKRVEIDRLLTAERTSDRVSKVKVSVRLDKGDLCKVFIRSKLRKTRTSEGQINSA